MRGGAGPLCWALLALLCRVRGDELVFRVPDVLVTHEPAPGRAVGTGPAAAEAVPAHNRVDGKRTAAAARREHHALSAQLDAHGRRDDVHYQEFFVEHAISALEARAAADRLRLQNIPAHAPGCGACSREEVAYCEWQVVADHCCCERRFQEPYPWIPHTCYAGPQPCRPVARDCGFYRRLRDCCCDRRLAEKWRAILSASCRCSPVGVLLVAASLLSLATAVAPL